MAKPKPKKCDECGVHGNDHAPKCSQFTPVACGQCGALDGHHEHCPRTKAEIDELARRRANKGSSRIESDVEVDGDRARFVVGHPADAPEFGDVPITLEAVRLLQFEFDLGHISIPGVKADDVCKVSESRVWKGAGIEVACPHRAVLRQIEKVECESCGSHKTSTVVYLCLLHAIEHYGAGKAIKDMGPLFAGQEQPQAAAAPPQPRPKPNAQEMRCPNCLQPLDEGEVHFDGETFTCDDADREKPKALAGPKTYEIARPNKETNEELIMLWIDRMTVKHKRKTVRDTERGERLPWLIAVVRDLLGVEEAAQLGNDFTPSDELIVRALMWEDGLFPPWCEI